MQEEHSLEEYAVKPVGFIRSELKRVEDAPMFYTQGAPEARLDLLPGYWDGLEGMQPGQEIIVITWLHLADRGVLIVHPQGDPDKPLTGVFSTRSPHRPNPVGLHRVRVIGVQPESLHIGPIEAIDGTPVIDIKSVVAEADDF